MAATKSYKVTGLWPKKLKSSTLLQASVGLEELKDILSKLEMAGWDRVVVEVWEAPPGVSEKAPTHILKLSEPFVPKAQYNNRSVERAIENKRRNAG